MKESILKQAGYIKGLLEGTSFENEGQHKLVAGMVELLTQLSDRVDALDEILTDLNDYVESIDDSLSELEDEYDDDFFDEDDFDDNDASEDDEEPDHFGSEQLHLLHSGASQFKGVVCPECGRYFFVRRKDPADAQYTCPNENCAKQITPVEPKPDQNDIVEPL